MGDIAAVTFGYGSVASRDSLKQRGLKDDDIRIVPVLFNPDVPENQLFRGYGVKATTGFDQEGIPAERRTLGIYNREQFPFDIFVPGGYELSGVVVPMTQEDLDKLTASENASAGETPMYKRGSVPTNKLSPFFEKDGQ